MFSPLELYVMTKLNCGSGDLEMLEELFSPLVDDLDSNANLNRDDLIKEEAETFNDLFYTLYKCASENIINKASELLEKTEENDKEKYKNIEEEIWQAKESYPYINFLDSSFGNDLDQTINWDKTIEENAKDLLEYWEK